MSLKSKLGILVLGYAVIGSALFLFLQRESYSTEAVTDSLWDKYSIQSTQFDDEHPTMSITVYDEEDITEVENYLKDNLSEEDLKDYQLNVYQYSENPKEFRENAQENLDLDYK